MIVSTAYMLLRAPVIHSGPLHNTTHQVNGRRDFLSVVSVLAQLLIPALSVNADMLVKSSENREYKLPLEAESSSSPHIFPFLNQAALGRLHPNAAQHTTVVHRSGVSSVLKTEHSVRDPYPEYGSEISKLAVSVLPCRVYTPPGEKTKKKLTWHKMRHSEVRTHPSPHSAGSAE